MLGLEAHRRCQPILEQDTWLECVVMFGLHSALGIHRSRIASQPVMGELPQRVPEDGGGSGSAVGWALRPLPTAPSCRAGIAPHCFVSHHCPLLPRTFLN